jgi:Transglycosylase SLT domain
MRACLLLPLCGLLVACEFSSNAGKVDVPKIMCNGMPDPLQANTTGDEFDCMILDSVATYMHPDPMLIKAQIAQESVFNTIAISPDSPCGVPMGWTDAESKSFGLTQVTPACNEASTLIMADGHPNLTTDMQSDLWPSSVFNPAANIDEGVRTCVNFLNGVKMAHPGCTDTEYALMSAGAFNSGPRSVLGCNMYNMRAQTYVDAVLAHYQEFSARALWPYRY